MLPRIALFVTLILSLILLPGCPPGVPSAFVGTWTFSPDFTSDTTVVLAADGSATSTTLDGPLTWEVNGTEFIMRQVPDGGQLLWVARVVSDTTMSGAAVSWEGPNLGNSFTFTAVKQ